MYCVRTGKILEVAGISAATQKTKMNTRNQHLHGRIPMEAITSHPRMTGIAAGAQQPSRTAHHQRRRGRVAMATIAATGVVRPPSMTTHPLQPWGGAPIAAIKGTPEPAGVSAAARQLAHSIHQQQQHDPPGAAHTGKRVYKHVRGKEIQLGRPAAMRTSSRGRRLGAPLPPWGV